MNKPPAIVREWEGRGWSVQVVRDLYFPETPLRVNTASAAPNGTQAMRVKDAEALAKALAEAVALSLNTRSPEDP